MSWPARNCGRRREVCAAAQATPALANTAAQTGPELRIALTGMSLREGLAAEVDVSAKSRCNSSLEMPRCWPGLSETKSSQGRSHRRGRPPSRMNACLQPRVCVASPVRIAARTALAWLLE